MNKYEVDPFNITNYNRSDIELQTLLCFCVAVAGKRAVSISSKIAQFFEVSESIFGSVCLSRYGRITPFNLLRLMRDKGHITNMIQRLKVGKTKVLTKAFTQFADWADDGVDLSTITVDQLETVCGVGFKTSRFFILHSRPDQKVAVLDTHLLAELRDLGFDAPKATPSSAWAYAKLEQLILQQARKARMSVADYDLMIWRKRTKTRPISKVISLYPQSHIICFLFFTHHKD